MVQKVDAIGRIEAKRKRRCLDQLDALNRHPLAGEIGPRREHCGIRIHPECRLKAVNDQITGPLPGHVPPYWMPFEQISLVDLSHFYNSLGKSNLRATQQVYSLGLLWLRYGGYRAVRPCGRIRGVENEA
jgi:hypothetical protein